MAALIVDSVWAAVFRLYGAKKDTNIAYLHTHIHQLKTPNKHAQNKQI